MVPQSKPAKARGLKGGTGALARHWLAWANLGWGIVFGLPWLAPVMMKLGAENVARVIYTFYSFLCHQFADRSFFLFGEQVMYSSGRLIPLVPDRGLWRALRTFVGSEALGYKVAWSDRMVAIYGGILLGGLLFALLRTRLAIPGWWVLVLLLIPMGIDGITHVVSDLAGPNVGFRYTNTWLSNLTQHRLAAAFYVGNGLGSFNSWARLITGALSGFAVVRAGYPILEEYFSDVEQKLKDQLQIGRPAEQGMALRHIEQSGESI